MGISKKEIKKIVYSVICALLSAIAISASGEVSSQTTFLGKLKEELNGGNIVYMIAAIAIFALYYLTFEIYCKNKTIIVHVLAALFSLSMLIGLSYSVNGNWKFIFNGQKQFLIAMIVFVGFYFLADVIITILFEKMGTVEIKNASLKHPVMQWIDKHFFLVAFLVIILCWAPFLIGYLPGTVAYDGYFQLNQAFGIYEMSNKHSWMLTYIYGALMRIGMFFGTDNFAVFFTVIVLYIVQALCYAEVATQIKKHGNLSFGIFSIAFFVILPVFGTYAQAIIKDNIFAALFAVYMIWCMDLCFENSDELSKKTLIFKLLRLFIVAVLACQFRRNGIYMVIPEFFILIFIFGKKLKKYAVILMICTIACHSGLNAFAYNVLGVEEGSTRAMLSIPFQQTARYLLEYPDDVTEEEAQAINAVLDYENLAENYDPERSDAVKNTYKDNEGALKEYFSAWFSMFMKHPGVYFEATLNNSYGYYYPFYSNSFMGAYPFNSKEPAVATGDFDIYYITSQNVRSAVSNYALLWRKIPILSQLVNPGIYTWILLVLAGYLIKKRKLKQLLFMIGPAINILICIASPVNGYLRYAVPLIACVPMLIFWVFNTNKKVDIEKSEIT